MLRWSPEMPRGNGAKLIEIGSFGEDCLVVFLYISFPVHNPDIFGCPKTFDR
jgi:hypothetical protein